MNAIPIICTVFLVALMTLLMKTADASNKAFRAKLEAKRQAGIQPGSDYNPEDYGGFHGAEFFDFGGSDCDGGGH